MQPNASHPHRPRALARLRPLALAALVASFPVAFIPVAYAQQSPTGTAPEGARRIEDRMTAAEFRAAGLDQLSDRQLANLNAWLNREIDSESAHAAQAAVRQAAPPPAPQQDRRGLVDFGSDEPVHSSIEGTFTGFREGRRYELDNGQVWEQVDNAELPGVTLEHPQVEITQSLLGSTWYLKVEGYNTRAKVRRVE